MKEDTFEFKIQELRKLYEMDKDVTTKHLRACVRNTANEIHDIKNNKKLSKSEKIWLWSMIGIIILAGLLNPAQYYIYFFASIFFFSGHFIGLKVRGFGLIFLVSHGMTGLALMITALLNTFESPNNFLTTVMTDLSQNATMYLYATAGVFILATLMTIVYNVSNKVKEKDHTMLYPITLYAIGFVMTGLFTKIMFTI